MKNFCKKLLPLWGVSCCFLPNKFEGIFKNKGQYKESIIVATKNRNVTEKNLFNPEKNKQVEEFLSDLNKIEIYLLVTDLRKEKINQPILLLLHTEDRLNSEQSLINWRHLKILFSLNRRNDTPKERKEIFERIVRPNKYPMWTKTFRSGKSYYRNKLGGYTLTGGYKSICPVFFDKASAEDFLIHTANNLCETLPLDDNKEILPIALEANKESLQGLFYTKIISIGLGDFIEYYSIDKNKNYLEKIEFLFIPCLQNGYNVPKEMEKKIKSTVKNKTFKDYQKEYYNLRMEK
jgi:hypothetical protein